MLTPVNFIQTGPGRRGRSVRTVLGVVFLLVLFINFSYAVSAGNTSPNLNTSGVPNRSISVDPVGHTEGYSAVLYNNTNGLPTSEANAIAETEEGFIWIGSYSGLIRYDGNSFTRLDSSSGIASVISLYVDTKNRLWIGTNDAGLAVMEQGQFRQWGEAEGLKSLRISHIVEDEQGTVYAATSTGIVMIAPDMSLRYLDEPKLNDAYIDCLRMGSDGLICGVTLSGDLFFLRNGALTGWLDHEENSLKNISYVLPDPQDPGKMYFGADNSAIYSGTLDAHFTDLTAEDISPLFNVTGIESIGGQLWICAENGIGVLDEAGFHSLQNLPVNNSIETIMTDYEGNLWFASSRQGIMKIVPNQFSDLFEHYGLTADVVNSTCLYGGQLFVGTDSGLTVLAESQTVDSLPLIKAATASGTVLEDTDLIRMLEGKRIRSIIRDSKGQLWISTWKSIGLLRYAQGTVTVFTEEDGLNSNRIRTVCEREDGSLLVVHTGGVSVIEGDQITAVYGKEDGIVNPETLTVAEGFHDDIVLGSNGNGLYIAGGGETRNITTKDGLTSGIIMRVKRDPVRRIFWIITSNSLAYMTEDYQITTIRQFPYSNNYDLYENSKGDLWILASNGIYVVPAEELLANQAIHPVYYGMGNGMPGIATANSYSDLAEDGSLYIAASEGVVKVNIESQFETVNDLKMSVPYVDIDGIRHYPDADGLFTIPANTRKLTISPFVFNFSLTDPQVTYQLEGFDEESQSMSRSDLLPIDYTNLKGGSYRFVLQLADSMGRGSKEMSVRIVKIKAFYEQTWFIVAGVLVFIVLLIAAIRFYVHRKMLHLERKHQEASILFEQTAEALASAIDAKDSYTNGHSRRVAEYSRRIAREAGKSEAECEQIYFTALLHDVGKIGVPIEIISKKGRLTSEEFEQIKQHPVIGGQILSSIHQSPWLSIGARYHHERYNGRGYPEGLKGKDIPEIARIIAVADAYDAMTSNRSYRSAIPQHIVREELVKGTGTQFDPEYAKIMLHLLDLDTEYQMQEADTGAAESTSSGLRCETIYHDCTDGFAVTNKMTRIRFCSQPDEGIPREESLPTLIVFDALDARVHPGEENNKDLLYFEYAQIRPDGHILDRNTRNTELKAVSREAGIRQADFGEPEQEQVYEIEAVRYKDHALIRILDENQIMEITLALPDSTRFSYISISGEHCYVHNIQSETEESEIDADYIPRIAEEISFIKGCPEGDVPNVQVDGWRTDASRGIPLSGAVKLKFHTRSLPTARLVWHCPFVSVYSAKDGQVNGIGFSEYILLRMDGENWDSNEYAENEMQIEKSEAFVGWSAWKDKHKEGLDCTVTIRKEGNAVILETENLGIFVRGITKLRNDTNDIFVALTGDQCAITDIHVIRE